MKKAFSYATKVWLLAVFVAPLLIGLYMIGSADMSYEAMNNINWEELLPTYGLTLLIGGGGTIPVWLFFGVLVFGINQLNLSMLQKKGFIQITSIILCIIAFGVFAYTLGSNVGFDFAALSIPYIITLSIGIWYFSLKENDTERILELEDHLIE